METKEFEKPSRRDFLKAAILGGGALIAEVNAAKNAFAKDIIKVLCADEKSGVLQKACEEHIDNESDRMTFLEALRSGTAFEEFGHIFQHTEFPERKAKILYPGSGAHIAPLWMVLKMMDEDKIDEADLTYTEVNPVFANSLNSHLEMIGKIIPDFRYEPKPPIPTLDKTAKAEHVFKVSYKGKTISIRLLINCCNGDWFNNDDIETSNILISHDAIAKSVSGPLKLLLKFQEGIKKKGMGTLPPVIIEDLTRMRDTDNSIEPFKRQFDMELLGSLRRGSHPYGHRKNNDKKPNGDNYNKELAEACHKNAVILKLFPQLLSLDPNELAVLMEIDLVAKNDGYTWDFGMGIATSRLAPGKRTDLFSEETFKDMINSAPKLLTVLRSINPVLASVFAIRTFQAMLKLLKELPYYIAENYPDANKGWKAIFDLTGLLRAHIDTKTMQKINTAGNIEAYVKKLQETHHLWVKAEQLLKEARAEKAYYSPKFDLGFTIQEEWRKASGINSNSKEKFISSLDKIGDSLVEAL